MRTVTRGVVAVLLMMLGIAACAGDDVVGTVRISTVTMRVLTPATVRTLAVSVSGPGIDPAVVLNLPVGADSTATGSLTLPAGSARRFVVTAVDTAGVETHRADTTVTLQPGANPNLAMRLEPLPSSLGITVTFGGVRLVVADTSERVLAVGDTSIIQAYAIRANGDTVPTDSLTWGTSNPAIFTVSGGVITAIRDGDAKLSVSYRGTAIRVRVVIWRGISSRSLTSGNFHNCGIASSGQTYCWGGNESGQLGDGSTVNSPSPVMVSGGVQFEALSAGSSHTCGLTAKGEAYCWGSNFYGQLGTGDNLNASTPSRVEGGHRFRSIAAGGLHSCAITAAGEAFCWGINSKGTLGDGSQTASNVPVRVVGNLAFDAIDSGNNHTCGVTAAGAAYCWGDNIYGQLGAGFQSNWSEPVSVEGNIEFAAVEVGGAHSCGVSMSGSAYCWGQNGEGQIGNPAFTAISVTTPTPVVGDYAFERIAVRGSHSCGGRSDGVVLCWGFNHKGQLGNGTTEASRTPVAVPSTVSFAVLQSGTQHMCALSADGLAYCWGGNERGQLGESTFEDRFLPRPVAGGITFRLR